MSTNIVLSKKQLEQIYASIRRDREMGSDIPKMMRLGKSKKGQNNGKV